jgi:hypothetical protein
MKKFRNLFRILFFLAIISAVSCEKIIDFLPGKPKNCHIKRIHFIEYSEDYYADFYYRNYYGNFYYNKWGNPDSVIFGFVSLGFTNVLFKYNNNKQLIQAKFVYSDGSYERWHKFGYTNGRITTDTFYVWGSNEEPEPLTYYRKFIYRYEYDNSGRIIKKIMGYGLGEQSFSYDANGNLITQQGLVYDNYTNIHVLHPIWQFLDCDYNLNNPISATSYNNFRLPLRFEHVIPRYEGPRYLFLGRQLDKSVIEYDCK